jgi:hypothetical protein
MFQYNKYLIKETDQFDPNDFAFVEEEMNIIREQTKNLPPFFKIEMIISFLKNHSLANEWTNKNPELTELITSGALSGGNIESLFASCRNKPFFSHQLEQYLVKIFSEKSEVSNLLLV